MAVIFGNGQNFVVAQYGSCLKLWSRQIMFSTRKKNMLEAWYINECKIQKKMTNGLSMGLMTKPGRRCRRPRSGVPERPHCVETRRSCNKTLGIIWNWKICCKWKFIGVLESITGTISDYNLLEIYWIWDKLRYCKPKNTGDCNGLWSNCSSRK